MRFWYLICLILFIDSISKLIEERYDVTYRLEYDPNWNQSIGYSACATLKSINSFKEYSNEFKFKNIIHIISRYLKKFKADKNETELIIKKIELKDYFIYKDFFCVIINKEDIDIIKEHFVKFVFSIEDQKLFRLKDSNPIFNQIIINNLELPYSDCKIKKLNRFKCLNDCYKKSNNLSKYYYHANETDPNLLIKIKFNKNKIKGNEIECLEECKKKGNDCKLIYFRKEIGDSSNTTIFTAYPSIGESDYWIQFIGLICFFTNLCFYYLLTKLFKLISNKIKIITIKIKKYKIKINLKKCLNYLKYFIISILFIYLIFLIYEMANEYLNKRDYPIKKEITTTELELKPINLVICIPLRFIPNYNYQLKTLSELENETSNFDLFNDSVKIYLEYQNKKIKTNYKLNDKKILFKLNRRCYQIEINPDEYKYQNQLLITKLVFEFKNVTREREYIIYLLTDDKIFNLDSYTVRTNIIFVKKEIKRSKVNQVKKCKDNDEIKLDHYYKCIKREYIDNDKNIPVNLIVDKDQFTDDKWNKLSFDYKTSANQYFDYCLQNNSIQIKCSEVGYENHLYKDYSVDNKFKIELYYDVIKEIEEEPSIYKLLMDILNIQSILFSLNIFNLIEILFNYKLIKFKYNKFPIYLLCSIGFSYHLWFIFNEIVNGELIYSQHYKLEETFKIPNLIFCREFGYSLINPNHKLTYKYLDKITNQLNINELTHRLHHLNESSEWIKLNNLNIDTFFFLNQKCFEFKLNIEYKLEKFELSSDLTNIVIKNSNNNNNNNFLKSNQIFFLTRISNTMLFSKLTKLPLSNDISIELMEIDYDDKFNLIKNPLSLIYGQNYINDANEYLHNLIDNFKSNYNLVTLNLPLNNNSNDLEIENQLFDQLYMQIQNSTDFDRPSNLNFKRTFIISNRVKGDYEFSLNLIFYKKIIKITNEDNYTKLILNLLNLLSLWFNIGLFDLHVYLDLIVIKIKFIFIFLYKLLIKIKLKLFIKLNLFKDHNVISRPKLRVSRFLKSYA